MLLAFCIYISADAKDVDSDKTFHSAITNYICKKYNIKQRIVLKNTTDYQTVAKLLQINDAIVKDLELDFLSNSEKIIEALYVIYDQKGNLDQSKD